MNWQLAISRNRTALLAVVAAIVALVGGREGGSIARSLRNAALALLRPAEAAARRLIMIRARGLVVARRLAMAFAAGLGERRDGRVPHAPAGGSRPPAFRLFDRRKRFGRLFRPVAPNGTPRIRTFWGPDASPYQDNTAAAMPIPAARPNPAEPVDAARLRLRLVALERALADLAHQARRLARWRTRHVPGPGGRPGSPLRLGHPPGHSLSAGRAVDAVLRECHLLALEAWPQGQVLINSS